MSGVLVDTSVWIDHLHRADDRLVSLLESGVVFTHPMIIGELALGSIRERETFLALLSQLPHVLRATDEEVLILIDTQQLAGTGVSLVDAHLLASALVTSDVRIWTRDRRLRSAAARAGIDIDGRTAP